MELGGKEVMAGMFVAVAEGGVAGLYLILQPCSSERRACAVGGGEEGGAPRTADCACCVCVHVPLRVQLVHKQCKCLHR